MGGALHDQFVESRLGFSFGMQRAGDFGHFFRVHRSTPAPQEGLAVGGDGGAVEFDRPLERIRRNRHQALLPGIAEQQHVGEQGIAHQARRQVLGVEEADRAGAKGVLELPLQAGLRELPVAVTREFGGRRRAAADDGARAPFEHLRQSLGAGADHQVAAEDGIGFAGGNARSVDVLRAVGDAQVGEHGAVLLRQAGHVEHRDALAIEVGGHAEQRA